MREFPAYVVALYESHGVIKVYGIALNKKKYMRTARSLFTAISNLRKDELLMMTSVTQHFKRILATLELTAIATGIHEITTVTQYVLQ